MGPGQTNVLVRFRKKHNTQSFFFFKLNFWFCYRWLVLPQRSFLRFVSIKRASACRRFVFLCPTLQCLAFRVVSKILQKCTQCFRQKWGMGFLVTYLSVRWTQFNETEHALGTQVLERRSWKRPNHLLPISGNTHTSQILQFLVMTFARGCASELVKIPPFGQGNTTHLLPSYRQLEQGFPNRGTCA